MTPPDDTQNAAEPALDEGTPALSGAGDPSDGRWVWQYGAPPPPPSFGARLFAANASPEFLRFAFCALLVVVGCLLPWGPQAVEAAGGAEAAEEWLAPPGRSGIELPLGALSFVFGVWMLYAALAGAYSGRHRILPVVLMIEPALVTLTRLLDAFDAAGDAGFVRALELAGSGVLMTFAGSAFLTLQFFFLLGKVFAKKDDKSGGARRGKDAAGGRSASKAGAKGKGRGGRARSGDKAAGDDAAGASEGQGDDAKTAAAR